MSAPDRPIHPFFTKTHRTQQQNNNNNSHNKPTTHRHRHHKRPKSHDPEHAKRISDRRTQLRAVAAETLAVLPNLTSQIPHLDFTSSTLYSLSGTARTPAPQCPGFSLPPDPACAPNTPAPPAKGTRIRILNADTLDTALSLTPTPTTDMTTDAIFSSKPVLVLNLASATSPGGGFLNGALAQEESLCYRTSLSLSLHATHYPLPTLSALYTPHVLVLRSSLSASHALLPSAIPNPNSSSNPPSLPLISTLTLAALQRPKTTKPTKPPTSPLPPHHPHYAHPADRTTTKHKIRLLLRTAAAHGHTRLVLGALGCGVFGNPPREVARCFREVFAEDEFAGGWWEDVVFAVMDNVRDGDGGEGGSGNYGVFWRELEGVVV